MRMQHINCGVFEVTDLDRSHVFFTGSREDCERFIRKHYA
jgi:hypothetical protein